MKINKYIYVLVLATFFVSCEDYLDKAKQADLLTQNDVFNDVVTARYFLDGAYRKLITEVGAKNGHADFLPAMTMGGEGYPGRLNNSVPQLYDFFANGDYLYLMNLGPGTGTVQTPTFTARYVESWKGIRIVNTFLENSELISNSTVEVINELKGEAYFLRAFCYHMLTKRHGGVVYLEKNLELNEPLDRERESYDSNLENMIEDLDMAISFLPVNWPSEHEGRPTRGAAMALKSRISLFGASPLVGSTQEKWEDAAIAASNLIDYGQANGLYTLVDASGAINLDVEEGGADLFKSEPELLKPYRNIFVGPGIQKTIPQGTIWMESNLRVSVGGNYINPVPQLSATAGFSIIKGNGNPMGIGAISEFVALYETKNGLAIEDDTSYSDQAPFINRDPRFYNTILFDGVPWVNTTTSNPQNTTGITDLAIVNEEGNIGADLNAPGGLTWKVYNNTGYMVRKFIPNGVYWDSGQAGDWNFYINNNVFRMAEVYLNYAEAANEAYGPTGAVPGQALTALDAVNKIRNRVGMPNVNSAYTGSTADLRLRILNERAIELAYEGHRYDDLRRWKKLEDIKKVSFLEMTWEPALNRFSYVNAEKALYEKTFDPKHYWWPIPTSEIEKVPSFKQTAGW